MGGKRESRRVISEFIAGEKLFSSNGFSTIKITKDGVEEFIDIPIKSSGVDELKKKIEGKKPRPPIARKFIKKNSPEGKEIGLSHDKFVDVLDFADEKYLAEEAEYESETTWKVVAFGIDWKIKDPKTGEEIVDLDQRVKALKDTGITLSQVTKIFKDIMNLTKTYEEELDFLSETP